MTDMLEFHTPEPEETSNTGKIVAAAVVVADARWRWVLLPMHRAC